MKIQGWMCGEELTKFKKEAQEESDEGFLTVPALCQVQGHIQGFCEMRNCTLITIEIEEG